MKIDIKKLSLFLVVFNALVMIKDLPPMLTASVFAIIILSFVVIHKKLRVFLKIALLISSLFLIKYLFKSFLVTEAGVSLVMILSALKLWELETENDHFNMFLILALLDCCLFLLNPSFIAFFFGMLKIIVFFYFILKIRNYDLALLNGKRLLLLMAPSLLLSLLLFYTFPRFTQGFLSASNNQLLYFGPDSKISFKKLGPLTLSNKIAFRVYGLDANQFTLPMLYWRQSVLWDYYRKEWLTGYSYFNSEQQPLSLPNVKYRVQLLQDYNEFLPLLDGLSTIEQSSLDYNFYSESSFRLKNITRIPVNYDATTSFKQSPKLFTTMMERKSLRLKSDEKDIIKKMILKERVGDLFISDREKLNLVIDFFKNRKYEYSLEPPLYNTLEEFILKGRSGYCSHFAAAFAYLARAVDLPSRVISGFQGGEFNPFDQSVIVREMDGHAWTEIYLKDSGWFKYDPTLVVAPGRINLGASSFHDKIEPFINLYYYQLPKSFFKFSPVVKMSLWLDSLNFIFDSNILNFDKERQQKVLSYLIPKSLSAGWIFTLALSGSLPLFWLFFNWLSRNQLDPHQRRYNRFLTRMSKAGMTKQPSETASAFRNRCLQKTSELDSLINEETDHYVTFYYQKSADLN